MQKNKAVLTKTPLRITFTGGGTDIPSFYKEYGPGRVISAAINKYIYVLVNKKFAGDIKVNYSIIERANHAEEIKHPSVREALLMLGIDRGIEIVSISDIPSGGTGLGSSSAFLVGLLNALHAWQGEETTQKQLAEEAIKIEREILKEPGGKQDQYISAFGGIQYMEFKKDESVMLKPISLSETSKRRLKDNLLMLYTGSQRKSTEIHKLQAQEIPNKVESYFKMREITSDLYDSFEKDIIDNTGRLLHENWILKKQLAQSISNPEIDSLYNSALKEGAQGGKLIGAGGSGFLLFYAEKEKHNNIKNSLKLNAEPFDFDNQGSRIAYIAD